MSLKAGAAFEVGCKAGATFGVGFKTGATFGVCFATGAAFEVCFAMVFPQGHEDALDEEDDDASAGCDATAGRFWFRSLEGPLKMVIGSSSSGSSSTCCTGLGASVSVNLCFFAGADVED